MTTAPRRRPRLSLAARYRSIAPARLPGGAVRSTAGRVRRTASWGPDGSPRARRLLGVLALAGTAVLTGACATAPEPEPPVPVGPQPVRPDLPPIPEVRGALDLRVSYPRDSAYIATRGRNFIFGSTGNGEASLRIDGEPVEVQPNGAFLAFRSVPDDGVYHLEATLGGETATLRVPVRLPPAPAGQAGESGQPGQAGPAPRILPGTVSPAGGWVARPGERIEASFTGTAGGEAWLEFGDGTRVPMVEQAPEAGGATDFEVSPGDAADADTADRDTADDTVSPARRFAAYVGFFPARWILSADTSVAWPSLAAGRPASTRAPAGSAARVALAVAGDTVRRALPFNLVLTDPDRPRVGVGWDPDPPARNGDEHVVARPGPGGGPYHYVWRNGVEMELTGQRGGAYRVRLTDDLSAWTPAGDTRLLPAGTPPPTSRVGTVRLDPQPGWIDVHIALDRRLPYLITEAARSFSIDVFGATSRTNFLQHGRVDPYIERAEWSQPGDRRFRLDLHLAGAPWGYEAFYGEGDDLVVRIKRPPAIDPATPLRGLAIGVDPGHGGSDRYTMGPTGFTEADANLGIALQLRDMLEAAGARVVMSRTADSTVSLVERTRLARAEDVDVWISVHNNAFPDGIDPWANNGTSVYYNHPRAAALAWSVQEALLDEMGLRDLGVGRADLHQPRFTWAPAILTENAFMMIPAQEAFLESDAGQRRVAEAHLRGLERWLREVASAASDGWE